MKTWDLSFARENWNSSKSLLTRDEILKSTEPISKIGLRVDFLMGLDYLNPGGFFLNRPVLEDERRQTLVGQK